MPAWPQPRNRVRRSTHNANESLGMRMTKESAGTISDLDLRQIISLVEALDRSNLDSMQLDVGQFRLSLGKSGAPVASIPSAPPSAPAVPKTQSVQPILQAAAPPAAPGAK